MRMRPLNKEEDEGEMIVQKVADDSLSINGHTFTFDSVADMEATQVQSYSLDYLRMVDYGMVSRLYFDTRSLQLDVFQLVGVPLVENCLSGFNSSVFAYGQVPNYLFCVSSQFSFSLTSRDSINCLLIS